MSDLISRDELLDVIGDTKLMAILDRQGAEETGIWGFVLPREEVLRRIMDAPAVDAVPVVHARWVFDRPYHYMCSVCSRMLGVSAMTMAYCPYCGAKMDGGDEQ